MYETGKCIEHRKYRIVTKEDVLKQLQIKKKDFFLTFFKNINNDECIEFVSNWWVELKLKIIIEMKNLSSFFLYLQHPFEDKYFDWNKDKKFSNT